MKFALIDIETLSPQHVPKMTDVITGIGIRSEEGNWIRIINPSGGRDTDFNETNLISEAIQHLKEVKPDVLTGCYIWGFDLPHLLCRANELDFQLHLDLVQIFNGLKIIDLAMTDYVLEELAPKYGKSCLKVEEICRELSIETKQFPNDLHVWVSAKAIAGDSKPLTERLESDLEEEWAILQALLSENNLNGS